MVCSCVDGVAQQIREVHRPRQGDDVCRSLRLVGGLKCRYQLRTGRAVGVSVVEREQERGPFGVRDRRFDVRCQNPVDGLVIDPDETRRRRVEARAVPTVVCGRDRQQDLLSELVVDPRGERSAGQPRQIGGEPPALARNDRIESVRFWKPSAGSRAAVPESIRQLRDESD